MLVSVNSKQLHRERERAPLCPTQVGHLPASSRTRHTSNIQAFAPAAPPLCSVPWPGCRPPAASLAAGMPQARWPAGRRPLAVRWHPAVTLACHLNPAWWRAPTLLHARCAMAACLRGGEGREGKGCWLVMHLSGAGCWGCRRSSSAPSLQTTRYTHSVSKQHSPFTYPPPAPPSSRTSPTGRHAGSGPRDGGS